MAVLHAYYCPRCNEEELDRWSDDVPSCCGKPMRVQFTKVNTPEWGSPRTYLHLRDEPFSSRSEPRRLREGERHGFGRVSRKGRRRAKRRTPEHGQEVFPHGIAQELRRFCERSDGR